MFGKKEKKEKEQIKLDYQNWEADFGFLQLLLNRKKGIVKEFVINIALRQRQEKDYFTDDDVEPLILNCVNDVVSSIGNTYKEFLVKKYFGTDEALISFITEDVYCDLVTDSILRNDNKIKQYLTKEALKRTIEQNNK